MEKPSSSVSSGNISPSIVGPSKDSKEVYVIGGVVLILAIAIGAVWFYSQEFLVGLGVSDQAIKVVSLGKDGALCLDSSDVCRNMNRRVHLEIRKIGKEHMILPTVATEPKITEPIQSADDRNGNTDGHGSLA